MSDLHQTREETGQQVRDGMRADVTSIIGDAHLSPAERALVLEALETAHTADRRDGDLAGARYLMRMANADCLGSLERKIAPVLEACAAHYVRPAP